MKVVVGYPISLNFHAEAMVGAARRVVQQSAKEKTTRDTNILIGSSVHLNATKQSSTHI